MMRRRLATAPTPVRVNLEIVLSLAIIAFAYHSCRRRAITRAIIDYTMAHAGANLIIRRQIGLLFMRAGQFQASRLWV